MSLQSTRVNLAIQQDSIVFNKVIAIDSDNVTKSSPDVGPAKTGTLTTRTNTTTGTLTMAASHGIITAAIIDLFWATGRRYGVVVGTVSVNSVPISGGSGNDLPIATTAITAMVPHHEDFVVTGDDARVILFSSPVPGFVRFYEADGTTLIGSPYELAADDQGGGGANYTFLWYTGSNATNPVASEDIGEVAFSHGNSSASQSMYASIQRN